MRKFIKLFGILVFVSVGLFAADTLQNGHNGYSGETDMSYYISKSLNAIHNTSTKDTLLVWWESC